MLDYLIDILIAVQTFWLTIEASPSISPEHSDETATTISRLIPKVEYDHLH